LHAGRRLRSRALSTSAQWLEADDALRADIAAFAAKRPRPVSLQEVLGDPDPRRLAKFIHSEVPVRYAERIRWIEEIPSWADIPELADVYARHVKTFREWRLVRRYPTLDSFTKVVLEAADQTLDVPHLVTAGVHRLHQERGGAFGSAFADRWLDNFLLNRISTEMLMAQYLALTRAHVPSSGWALGPVAGGTGIIDPHCNVAEVCQMVAYEVQEMCAMHTGRTPSVNVEMHSSEDDGVPRLSYIPMYIRYILCEILKNSCRATAEAVRSHKELERRPISIVVCADERQVAIRIADRGGGIPMEVGQQVWSYLYTTAAKGDRYGEKATPLAGFGVGLPLSRLYARYLGGSLDLVNLPGYGVRVHVSLPRIRRDQVEVVPDDDNDDQE